MSTHWQASPSVSTIILSLVAAHERFLKDAKNLAKEFGGKPWISRGFSRWTLEGVIRETPPDPKLWKYHSKRGFYAPRSTSKAAKALRDRLNIHSDLDDLVMKVVNVPTFNGSGWHSPGILIRDDTVYLTLYDGAKPKGCTRIADIEFEKIKPRRKSK